MTEDNRLLAGQDQIDFAVNLARSVGGVPMSNLTGVHGAGFLLSPRQLAELIRYVRQAERAFGAPNWDKADAG